MRSLERGRMPPFAPASRPPPWPRSSNLGPTDGPREADRTGEVSRRHRGQRHRVVGSMAADPVSWRAGGDPCRWGREPSSNSGVINRRGVAHVHGTVPTVGAAPRRRATKPPCRRGVGVRARSVADVGPPCRGRIGAHGGMKPDAPGSVGTGGGGWHRSRAVSARLGVVRAGTRVRYSARVRHRDDLTGQPWFDPCSPNRAGAGGESTETSHGRRAPTTFSVVGR